MKKFPVLLCMFLVFSLMLCPSAFAAGDNFDTLADWDIRISVPEDASAAVLQGHNYYIYAQHEGYIPYVMVTATANFSSEEEFIDYMNEYMASQYQDQSFRITAPAELKTIGDRLCYEVDYSYTISGLEASDRRIFITVGDLTYMFASKEIASRGWTVGTMLEDVVANCVFLAEEPDAPVEHEPGSSVEVADAYLYSLENGMPKYWLDFSGAIIDNPVLHCYFRSGDPTFYESYYILDLETAEFIDSSILFHDLFDGKGHDVSDWFESFSVAFSSDGVLLNVKRDDSTLAGGAEDNILTGEYFMTPVRVAVSYDCRDNAGTLQYRLVPNGENVEIHGAFRSGGDPESYKEIYILDGASAEQSGEYVTSYKKIFKQGSDISRWFQSVVLSQAQTSYILSVTRDESTVSGGGEDTLLTGSYVFDPTVSFLPPEEGPYPERDLALLAQRYYFLNTGFFPPEAEVQANDDGSFTIHLFEIIVTDDVAHTATSAWYTVDPFGVGINDITGEEVRLAS